MPTNDEIAVAFREAMDKHGNNMQLTPEGANAMGLLGIALMLHETNFQLTELNQKVSTMTDSMSRLDITLVNWSHRQ